MLRPYCVLVISLIAPPPDQDAFLPSLEDQLHRPFVELLEDRNPVSYSDRDLRSLRSELDRTKKQEIEKRQKIEEDSETALDVARRELKAINGLSSRDTVEASARREELHRQIAGLDAAIQTARLDREQIIPDSFEIKYAKLRLIEDWPRRREEIAQRIEEGRARERKRGDIEDIGYRDLEGDQREDISVGRQSVQEMKAGGWIPSRVQDEQVQSYVRSLTNRLARNSDLKIPLHADAIDSPEIRAISVPGGFLFVTSGLILATGSEHELSGMISREIGRIAARHGVRESKGPLVSRILAPAVQIAAMFFTGGITNQGANFGIGYGVQSLGALVDRAFGADSGKYRKEADQLGIQYAWKAGYDPRGLIGFVDSMVHLHEEKQYSATAGFFPKDSSLGERLLDAFAEIEYLAGQENYEADSGEFWRMKARLKK
jgi:hypothetical protein